MVSLHQIQHEWKELSDTESGSPRKERGHSIEVGGKAISYHSRGAHNAGIGTCTRRPRLNLQIEFALQDGQNGRKGTLGSNFMLIKKHAGGKEFIRQMDWQIRDLMRAALNDWENL